MNEKYLSTVKLLTASVAVPAMLLISQPEQVKASKAPVPDITCDTTTDTPTVVASVEGSKGKQQTKMLTFLTDYFPDREAKQECQATADTLQMLYTANEMNYLASDTIDGELPVVCAVQRRGVGCDSYSAKVLFALDRQINPAVALYNMLGKDFKRSELPDSRTVSRIYTDLTLFDWLPF